MRKTIHRLRNSLLAKNTFWMFMGQGMRVFVQAGYFVIIARMLGPAQYGSFGAVMALAAILSPYTSVGFGALVIKKTVEDRGNFRWIWGNALVVTIISGLAILAVMGGLSKVCLPSSVPILLVIQVGVADVICNCLIDIASQCFQAVEQMKYTAAIALSPSLARTGFAVYQHVVTPRASAAQWGADYMWATILAAAVGVALVCIKLGTPQLRLRGLRVQMKEGIYFSIGLSSQTIYNDIDKTMLARLSTLDAAGIYMTAYRIIDMSFMPVLSLARASYPQFFRAGQKGIQSSYAYAKRLLPRAIGYGAAVAIFLLLSAPIIPKILGPEYARSVEALRWLSLLPLLKSIHYFLASALTGANYQKSRALVQVGIAILNVLANLWVIPRYSWRGAAWISIVCDGTLVLGLLGTVLLCNVRERANARLDDAELQRQAS